LFVAAVIATVHFCIIVLFFGFSRLLQGVVINYVWGPEAIMRRQQRMMLQQQKESWRRQPGQALLP